MPPFKLLAVSALVCSGAAQALTLPPLPVACDDVYLLDSLTLNIAAPGLLENDSGTHLLLSGDFNPGAGTLNRVVTDGGFVDRPAADVNGVATFRCVSVDEPGRFSGATVTINVGVVPEPAAWLLLLGGLLLLVHRAARATSAPSRR